MRLRNFVWIGVIAVVLIGGFIFRDVLSGQAADLQVGDCFDLPPATQTEVDEVQHRPCTDDHQAEAFFVENYPGSRDDPFPGAAAMDDFIAENCIPAFVSYTGKDYYTDEVLDLSAFTPVSEGWKQGDQEVTCFLFRIDEAKFKGSQKAG